MKIYIMVDMEGISGIFCTDQVDPTKTVYAAGRQYMTGDVNACVEGCFRGGATEVVVQDAHHAGFNLIWDELDSRAQCVQGKTWGWRMPALKGSAGLILLGYHAMAGERQAVMEHTMTPAEWQNCWINGRKAGEIAIDAGIAGDQGVPTILVSGDDKACREARRWMPGVVTAPVKKGLSVQQALLLPREQAHALIRRRAEAAVGGCESMQPLKIRRPVKMRLELVSRGRVPAERAHVRVIDGRTYEVTGRGVEEALWRLV